ncbi:MAG: transglutaminase domain-containing protein [Paracoccaceae bacterium]
MRLSVNHASVYSFSYPVRYVVQSHRLHPNRFDGQRIVKWRVSVEGARFGAPFRDGAGDTLRTVSLTGPVERVEVRVKGIVETTDMSGVLAGHRERINPLAYLRDTPATLADAALTGLAKTALRGAAGADALDRAHRLSNAVADAIAYRPGSTQAHTTAAEALALGEGVCQDHAHALIAVARHRAIPARYVTGYLHAGGDGSPHEAGHAWAELHVGGLGWVGFDPANRCCPDERYIRLGSGLDASDAAPIRGVTHGEGTEMLHVTVEVAAAQQ